MPTTGAMLDCQTATQREPLSRIANQYGAHQRTQQNQEHSRGDEGWGLRRQRFAAEGLFGYVDHWRSNVWWGCWWRDTVHPPFQTATRVLCRPRARVGERSESEVAIRVPKLTGTSA